MDWRGHFSVKIPLDGFFYCGASRGEIDDAKGRGRMRDGRERVNDAFAAAAA